MIARNNTKVRQLKNQPKQQIKCQMCKKVSNIKPYELTLVSFTGLEDTIMKVCKKCAYKETYGTKGMVKAMKESKVEKEKTN